MDETLNRVARKLQEGLEVQAEDPFRYVIGVAHKVFHEVLRHDARRRKALQEVRHEPDPVTQEDRLRLRCLDECLQDLGADGEWILSFYEGEKGVVRTRQAVQERTGRSAASRVPRRRRRRWQVS